MRDAILFSLYAYFIYLCQVSEFSRTNFWHSIFPYFYQKQRLRNKHLLGSDDWNICRHLDAHIQIQILAELWCALVHWHRAVHCSMDENFSVLCRRCLWVVSEAESEDLQCVRCKNKQCWVHTRYSFAIAIAFSLYTLSGNETFSTSFQRSCWWWRFTAQLIATWE